MEQVLTETISAVEVVVALVEIGPDIPVFPPYR